LDYQWKIFCFTVNNESLEWLMFGKLALKKVGGRKFGKLTVHPIVNNTKANWQINV